MRKIYSLLLLLSALVLSGQVAVGQSQPVKETFPAYNQIKPPVGEIVDHPDKERIVKYEPMNLFDYPAGTVTYVLNGKLSTDVNYVKQVVDEQRKEIDSISIGKPDQQGKRIIDIKYVVPKL